MKADSIFAHKTYKSYLRHRFSGKENRGSLTRIAAAAGCQRSYLSRVLTSEIQITPDQAFRMTEHWRLTQLERDYFLTLVELERSGDAKYRQLLESRLKRLRSESEDLSRRTQKPPTISAGSFSASYASYWQWSAIHILTSIESFSTEQEIADRLRLPLAFVQAVLQQLSGAGYVLRKGKGWTFASGEMHIPKNSPSLPAFHRTWRDQASQAGLINPDEGLHLTNVQSMSRSDFIRLKHDLADFIERYTTIAAASPSEELTVLTVDLFVP